MSKLIKKYIKSKLTLDKLAKGKTFNFYFITSNKYILI